MKINVIIWGVIGLAIYEMFVKNKSVSGIGAIESKSKFMPPYKQMAVPELGWKTETNFKFAQNKPGVYIIKKNGIIVYIGSSTQNVYAQMLRHFEPYEKTISSQFENTDYAKRKKILQTGHKKPYWHDYEKNDYRVRVIITNTALQSKNLEIALIKKYGPPDNFIYNDPTLYYYELSNAENKILEEFEQAPF